MKYLFNGFSNSRQSAATGNLSLLVEHNGYTILVDTSGSPAQALRIAGLDPLQLDAIMITHAHCDHTYAFPSIIQDMLIGGRTKALRVLGNQKALDVCKKLIGIYNFDKKTTLMPISWEITEDNTVTLSPDMKVTSFALFHRPLMPVQGFIFATSTSKLSFFPDSVATEPYPQAASGSDVVIHEAGGVDADRLHVNQNGHSTGTQAGILAKKLNAGKLIVCHLPSDETSHQLILEDAQRHCIEAELPKVHHWYDL
ncbi:MAG: MBL fold metallo-hydrolase [Sphaerochaetaceae bacterium]|jgi:ribonuclease Z|nr:MBL fold metallo-hydrolase [Sphaerochaetaceae bacterium]